MAHVGALEGMAHVGRGASRHSEPMLVGESGAGKTALLTSAQQRPQQGAPIAGLGERDERGFTSQMSKLRDMGYLDAEANARALERHGGDVSLAVDWLVRHAVESVGASSVTAVTSVRPCQRSNPNPNRAPPKPRAKLGPRPNLLSPLLKSGPYP